MGFRAFAGSPGCHAGGMIRMVTIWAVLAAFLGVAELMDPEDGRGRSIDRRDLRTDAFWGLLYLLYMPALGTAITAATSVAWLHSPVRALVAGTPWGLQLGGGLVVAEVAAYWVHRLQHTVQALWRIHSVHHSSETLRWWSAFRSHPLDTAVSHGVPVIVAAACGAGPGVLVAYLAAVTVVTVLAHADVHVPRTPMRWVAVTPAFHRSHHELGRETTNFALVLPLCDVVFGTSSFVAGARSFGSASHVPRHGVLAQLAWGFGAQRVIATPSTSEAMLAHALVASATVGGTRRSVSIAASPITTETSVTTRAAAPPAGLLMRG